MSSSAVSSYLAGNLQTMRKAKGYSQAQLSQLSEIPRTTITHMESGEGNPSLNNLCRLADSLQVSIEELLSPPRDDCALIPANKIKQLEKAGGKVTVKKLMPDKIKGIEIDEIQLTNKASMGGQPHLQGTKEYLMPIKGSINVFVSGKSYLVKKGDVFAFPGDQKHSYKNAGAGEAKAISVVLPVPHLLK